MYYADYREWLKYLLDTGVIPFTVYGDMLILLENRKQSVHTQAIQFLRRMAQEKPDVYTSFRAKKRILEGVKI